MPLPHDIETHTNEEVAVFVEQRLRTELIRERDKLELIALAFRRLQELEDTVRQFGRI